MKQQLTITDESGTELDATKQFKTACAGIHITNPSIAACLREAVRATSAAVQRILLSLEQATRIEYAVDGKIASVDLIFICPQDAIDRARKHASRPRPKSPVPGPKGQATPQYKNSYRLEEILQDAETGDWMMRFRVAESFAWQVGRGEDKGKILQDLAMADAKNCLQQIIYSWMRPIASDVPSLCLLGACQKAAEQFNSFIGLLWEGSQTNVRFPSTEERDPEKRRATWLTALAKVCRRNEPFTYQKAREIDPSKYGVGDRRGDRLVNVDPDWIEFVKSPEPWPLPLNFVKSADVVVYEHTWIEQRGTRQVPRTALCAAIPLFKGVAPDSPLGKLATNKDLFKWHAHVDQYKPLANWDGTRLKPSFDLLMVPLQHDEGKHPLQSRFAHLIGGETGRVVNWSLLVQHKDKKGRLEWGLRFSTSKVVATPSERTRVLGVHFCLDPIIWWAICDDTGEIVQEGKIEGNAVLNAALAEKLRLEGDQKKQRWVGDRKSSRDLERRTYEIARTIAGLASQHDAALALEELSYVQKCSSDLEANKRFSQWNYAQLPAYIAHKGLDLAPAVGVIAEVSDYLLRYTCPACGACRKAKQDGAKADTWRENGTLLCRKCGYTGPVPDDHQARLVAQIGMRRLQERKRLKLVRDRAQTNEEV